MTSGSRKGCQTDDLSVIISGQRRSDTQVALFVEEPFKYLKQIEKVEYKVRP